MINGSRTDTGKGEKDVPCTLLQAHVEKLEIYKN